jgi:hypothetical protein
MKMQEVTDPEITIKRKRQWEQIKAQRAEMSE